jgi:hypothetical protein
MATATYNRLREALIVIAPSEASFSSPTRDFGMPCMACRRSRQTRRDRGVTDNPGVLAATTLLEFGEVQLRHPVASGYRRSCKAKRSCRLSRLESMPTTRGPGHPRRKRAALPIPRHRVPQVVREAVERS